ncbi:MAG: MarR family winged helix-turn-helix transcriptional regulator [Ignavibacteriae bacterium]|nr:MarR family winged helix-turn-helix transcriptional regulator [Ignavibacteriota bacterium]
MPAQSHDINAIRKFNRFYTNVIGLVNDHILHSPYSLAEVRVLYEVKHTRNCTARQIMRAVTIDEGYLSRILNRFVQRGFVKRTKSRRDRREYFLTLTKSGEAKFARLNDASSKSVQAMVKHLSPLELRQLLTKMDGIQHILSKERS